MKTIRNLSYFVFFLLWVLLILMGLFNMTGLGRIAAIAGLVFVGWLGIAIHKAKTMDDDYDEPKYYRK